MSTMVEPGQYSDTLRALGAFIERTGAVSVEIVDRGDNWLVAATLGLDAVGQVLSGGPVLGAGPKIHIDPKQ